VGGLKLVNNQCFKPSSIDQQESCFEVRLSLDFDNLETQRDYQSEVERESQACLQKNC